MGTRCYATSNLGGTDAFIHPSTWTERKHSTPKNTTPAHLRYPSTALQTVVTFTLVAAFEATITSLLTRVMHAR
ncbi:predicted protein [Plenodomus lingam JN3]|uniref:Predicted protein n=1 Tax=Leptosphaeria maculans (strain JN3 / isolate v23.1.3 / race Av1-4-5-6-7-8) TaxID=985895 RepID=E5A9N8_LEPMJ|nr:predicted protein [Plenodomus lingam JN3]CBY00379.1 predicted protein [Plenodomus lingam JN3]